MGLYIFPIYFLHFDMWEVIYKDNWTLSLKYYLQWCSISTRGERGDGQRDQHAQQSPVRHDPDLLIIWAVDVQHPTFICFPPSSCTSALPPRLDKKSTVLHVQMQTVQCFSSHRVNSSKNWINKFRQNEFPWAVMHVSFTMHWDITHYISVHVTKYYICNNTDKT